jgi:hypothetical protein
LSYNLNLTSNEAITFSGAGAPTGTCTKTVFTSTNITDNNESVALGGTPVVSPAELGPSYNCGSGGDTLAPYSMVTYTWSTGGSSSGPTFAIGSSQTPSAYVQPVTLTATLTGTSSAPTGSVTFFNGSSLGTATLATTGGLTSTATLTTSALPVGTDSISVTYLSSTSSPFNQVVTQDSCTATSGSSVNPTVGGQPTTLTATVTCNYAPPTGSVTFTDAAGTIGSATLISGQWP